MFGQRPYRVDESWSALVSDEGLPDRLFDNFAGVAEPITSLRFWGLSATQQPSPCFEQPQTFSVQFHTDSSGWPRLGSPLYQGDYTLSGELFGYYPPLEDSIAVYQYDVVLSPPLTMSSGWVSVQGLVADGSPSCMFWWMKSPIGDGDFRVRYLDMWLTENGNLSVCLSSGCAAADSLVIQVAAPSLSRQLSFHAPADGAYQVWRSADKNAEYPATFTLVTTITASAGTVTYIDSTVALDYARYAVVHDCGQ